MKKCTLTIQGEIWEIIPCRRKDMNPNNDGECDLANKKIYIYNRLAHVDALVVLFHELYHAQHPYIEEDYVRDRTAEFKRAIKRTGLVK